MLDPYFTATKITYLLRHGDLALGPESPDLSFGTVDAWLLWKLTGGTDGGVFATDPSNASRTMLLNTATLAWSDELCSIFDVPPHTLPEIHPSAGRFGRAVLPDLGPAGGLLDGAAISGVLGDQQAALFGQACFEPGMVKVTYGTGSFVLANAGPDRPAAPDGLTVSVAWDLGRHGAGIGSTAYALEGSTFVSGAAIQWLRDGLGLISQSSDIGPLAESVSDSGGVTFVPALTGLGSPWWDPAARGTMLGLTRGAGRAQIARACVEAIAFQVRDMTDAMNAASAYPLVQLRADGGAAAMDLLLQLQAEQSRMPVARPTSLESTALGAATVAGLAEGMWSSVGELADLWSASARYEPDLPVELTDAVYAVWQRAIERSRGWAREEE
jgi:glycerol kinase